MKTTKKVIEEIYKLYQKNNWNRDALINYLALDSCDFDDWNLLEGEETHDKADALLLDFDKREGKSPVLEFGAPVTEIITLNRRGFFVTKNHTPTQCNITGHEAYNYQAEIKCGYKLDDSGFIIDHWLLHKSIVRHIDTNPMLSCEVMSKQIAIVIANFMAVYGCDVRSIKTTIIPCGKGQLKKDSQGFWVAKNPMIINYNTPANAIYHVKLK